MLRVILLKIKQRLKTVLKRYRPALKVHSHASFYQNCFNGPVPDKSFFVERNRPRFHFINDQCDQIVAGITKADSKIIDNTVNDADRLLCEGIALLGSPKVSLHPPIAWHRDCAANFTWPKESAHLCRIVDFDNDADVKRPWELSRLQFIHTLGRAYRYTGHTQYRNTYQIIITDWETQNPVGIGVNWTCPMEIAIRAINIIWGLYLFSDNRTALPDSFIQDQVRLLYYHGLSIEKNLETIESGANTNHLIADYLGLWYLGVLFPEFDRAHRWRTIAAEGLESEIIAQTFDDGADYECSFGYHRLVLEMFLSAYLIGERNEFPFSQQYKTRLTKMISFSQSITPASGLTPMVGDNDDGFILTIGEMNPADHRQLIQAGSQLLDLAHNHTPPADEFSAWFTGSKSPFVKKSLKKKSIHHKNSGYAVLQNNSSQLLFTAGTITDKHLAGHKHNDLLSVTYEYNGRQIFIDPGTGSYTGNPEQRNYNRSVNSHNTIIIDNEEPNPILPNRLFYLKDSAKPVIDLWVNTPQLAIVSGIHQGYTRLNDEITHRRTVWHFLSKESFIIQDDLTGREDHKHTISSRFITPLTDVTLIDTHTVRLKGNGINHFLQFSSQVTGLISIEPFNYHPRYGHSVEGRVISFNQNSQLPVTNMISFAPMYRAKSFSKDINGELSNLDKSYIEQIPTFRNTKDYVIA